MYFNHLIQFENSEPFNYLCYSAALFFLLASVWMVLFLIAFFVQLTYYLTLKIRHNLFRERVSDIEPTEEEIQYKGPSIPIIFPPRKTK